MTSFYTDSKGQKVEIADMEYNHLKHALAKAIRTEERRHEEAYDRGQPYDNPAREAEIAAMQAEVTQRDAAYAAQNADAIEAGEGFRPR